MRTFLIYACRLTVLGVVFYGAFQPGNGVMFRGVGMSLALGLVGLGLCMEARREMLRTGPARAPVVSRDRAGGLGNNQ